MRHLVMIYLPISATLTAGSIGVLVFYRIDKSTHEANLEKLHTLARALLERESLDGEEIARLLRVPPLQGAPTPA